MKMEIHHSFIQWLVGSVDWLVGGGQTVRVQSDKVRSLCDPQKRCKIAVDKKEREKQTKREWAESGQCRIVSSAEMEVVIDGVIKTKQNKKHKAKTKQSHHQKKGVKKGCFEHFKYSEPNKPGHKTKG